MKTNVGTRGTSLGLDTREGAQALASFIPRHATCTGAHQLPFDLGFKLQASTVAVAHECLLAHPCDQTLDMYWRFETSWCSDTNSVLYLYTTDERSVPDHLACPRPRPNHPANSLLRCVRITEYQQETPSQRHAQCRITSGIRYSPAPLKQGALQSCKRSRWSWCMTGCDGRKIIATRRPEEV